MTRVAHLAINGGFREGSQYGLTWDMVDWKARMLNIPRTKNEEPKHVPLYDTAVAALRVVYDRGEGRGRVFQWARTGEPLENGQHWSEDTVMAAGIKNFRWHDLRYRFASRRADEGRGARGYCRFAGAQEFGHDQAVRTSAPEQTACGGILAGSNCHHNCRQRNRAAATTSQVVVQ